MKLIRGLKVVGKSGIYICKLTFPGIVVLGKPHHDTCLKIGKLRECLHGRKL